MCLYIGNFIYLYYIQNWSKQRDIVQILITKLDLDCFRLNFWLFTVCISNVKFHRRFEMSLTLMIMYRASWSEELRQNAKTGQKEARAKKVEGWGKKDGDAAIGRRKTYKKLNFEALPFMWQDWPLSQNQLSLRQLCSEKERPYTIY